jgi:hypothetical protein
MLFELMAFKWRVCLIASSMTLVGSGIAQLVHNGCPRKCVAIASKGKRFISSPNSSEQLLASHSPLLIEEWAVFLWG